MEEKGGGGRNGERGRARRGEEEKIFQFVFILNCLFKLNVTSPFPYKLKKMARDKDDNYNDNDQNDNIKTTTTV